MHDASPLQCTAYISLHNHSVYWHAGGSNHALGSARMRAVALRRIQQQEKDTLMQHHAISY